MKKPEPSASPSPAPAPDRGPEGPGLWPSRVAVERVEPQVDGGRFPIKRSPGEEVVVTADIHADGHDLLSGVVRWRHGPAGPWEEAPMTPLGNDRWMGRFPIRSLGRYQYTVEAWIDRFSTWLHGLRKKVEARQDVKLELLAGAELIEAAAARATEGPSASRDDASRLAAAAAFLRSAELPEARAAQALSPELAAAMARRPDRSVTTVHQPVLEVTADRERARFSAWYEMFPRSASSVHGRHGTLRDCLERLPYVAEMGFDVLYLPPLHPIGRGHRKGKNNSLQSGPGDPGSPWAIGSEEGGHTAIHPDLGTLHDFRHLVRKAEELGMEVALDVAFQCSPDHPWVREHPEWFRRRPDGSIQYAENPPKKYQDIYPLNFETPAWRELYRALRDVFLFWIAQGVKAFRVDNPHTKPYGFWEWVIREVQEAHPDAIFLSEAFTRPKVMARLAKVGFSQSYTYFAWRNTKVELAEYLTELTRTELKEYFRPNLWPNTPDILPEALQGAGRPAFAARLVLAATLGASYGIYGPAFELLENRPLAPGKEEYLDSEKYEVRHWDLDRPESLRGLIARLNRIRRESPALQSNASLRFVSADRDSLIAYIKSAPDGSDAVLTVVNLDPQRTQSGWLELPLEELGIDATHSFQAHDLLSDARYRWQGRRNYVELDPRVVPAHIFKLRRSVRTEKDFEYFL